MFQKPFLISALRVYRHLGDISMVWSLEEVKNVEDLNLLSGHIHMILGDLHKAQVGCIDFPSPFNSQPLHVYVQECYLKSPLPELAIDMHTDVMEWKEALNLAERLASHKVGWLAREYAQQLEQTYSTFGYRMRQPKRVVLILLFSSFILIVEIMSAPY